MTAIPHTLSALAAGALLLSAAGAAGAQTPYTAYNSQARDLPGNCRNVQQLANGYVSAECQTAGGWRWSSLRPVDCRSSITNRDGVLTCTGARTTVGSLYPDDGGYGGQTTGATQQPGGIIGALLGAVFGNTFGNDQQIEDDYSQGRRPLYERRADLEARIDAGVRDGSLSRSEATRLRADYNALVQLETRYAADGRLTTAERDDLRARYQALSQRVGDARDDDGYGYGDGYGWRPLAEQRAAFDARVDLAVRDRRLSRTESTRLRADFDALVRLEADYRRDGLSDRERQDLTARLADLDRRVGDVTWDGGYGTDGRAVALETRITAGERNGSISRTEAARLREELRDLTRRWADLEARVDARR
ncbi:MAG: hypothetical protein Q8R45_06990 [Brevundimonas sp.]|uniref:hypothetical protein n=1 Tax=Brevundimonas sp. TaxID=1871086 RepID=UPI002720DD54|nr:hypothetical protein [Brevundimonas sp.]MDO9588698.1 hypothetical protein [Brevundimonas sp.]MDP3368783.1 hypothetical protein [Brevundimonas sp.]MDP3656691.1 hypothetical protein [Brevundimonas sp.]